MENFTFENVNFFLWRTIKLGWARQKGMEQIRGWNGGLDPSPFKNWQALVSVSIYTQCPAIYVWFQYNG